MSGILSYTGATDGSARSSHPPSESPPSQTAGIKQGKDQTTPEPTQQVITSSATPELPVTNLIDEPQISHEEYTFSIELYKAGEDDLYADLDSALADEFVSACVNRMESFLHDFDAVFDQT